MLQTDDINSQSINLLRDYHFNDSSMDSEIANGKIIQYLSYNIDQHVYLSVTKQMGLEKHDFFSL